MRVNRQRHSKSFIRIESDFCPYENACAVSSGRANFTNCRLNAAYTLPFPMVMFMRGWETERIIRNFVVDILNTAWSISRVLTFQQFQHLLSMDILILWQINMLY